MAFGVSEIILELYERLDNVTLNLLETSHSVSSRGWLNTAAFMLFTYTYIDFYNDVSGFLQA